MRKMVTSKDGYRSIARIVWFLFLLLDRHSSLGRWRRSCTALEVAARKIVSGRRLRHLHSPALFHPSFIAGTCKNLAYLPFFYLLVTLRSHRIHMHGHQCAALSLSVSVSHTTMPQSHCWELRVSPLTNYTSNSTIPLCDFYLDALLFQSHLALKLLAES